MILCEFLAWPTWQGVWSTKSSTMTVTGRQIQLYRDELRVTGYKAIQLLKRVQYKGEHYCKSVQSRESIQCVSSVCFWSLQFPYMAFFFLYSSTWRETLLFYCSFILSGDSLSELKGSLMWGQDLEMKCTKLMHICIEFFFFQVEWYSMNEVGIYTLEGIIILLELSVDSNI